MFKMQIMYVCQNIEVMQQKQDIYVEVICP